MIVKWIFEIVLIMILSVMYYLNKPVETSIVMQVPKGSINNIITHLKAENYDVNKLDSFLLRFIGTPQSGWIYMKETRSTKADFLYKLTKAKAALVEVTLIPGETTYVFCEELAQKLGLDADLLRAEFRRQSPIVEGALVPNTYKVPMGIDEKKLIEILLSHSLAQMEAISKKIFGTFNQEKWFRFVAIASVIEKESANKEEMPLVSSVIYNRLKKGMKLQMDGTLNYGPYSHIKITPQRIRNDESYYNTYKHSGIPKFPVCNVSFDAIRAAIYPAQTDYLYFMKMKNGTHSFTCNYSTHLGNIRDVTK